jgi:hypothetical protein
MRKLKVLLTVCATLSCVEPLAAEELPFDFKVFAKDMKDISSASEPISLLGFRYSKDETELVIYFTSNGAWRASNCNKISGGRWLCTGGFPLHGGATIISQGAKLPPPSPPPPPSAPKPPSPMVKCILPDASKEEVSAEACKSLGGHPGG